MGARRSKKREIIVNAVREVAARYEEQKEIYHEELVRLGDMRETAIQAIGF